MTLGNVALVALAAASGRRSSSSTAPWRLHDSFSHLVDRYDAFILDQFGVLHDGVTALPGAVECVKHLSEQHGKPLVILSNTSAPADKALIRLPKLGFSAHHFVGAVTSGEEASKYVKATYGSGHTSKKALFFTWDASKPDNPRLTALPSAFLDQCGSIEIAESVADADFVLLHGSEILYAPSASTFLGFIETGDLSAVDPILSDCLDRGLPLVCANPDFVVRTPTGGQAHMPGRIAERYQSMGGDCEIFGKPSAKHFLACLDVLDLDASRVAHVGDSLHHDVAGAMAAGVDSIFVTSGIHAQQLGTEFGALPAADNIQNLLDDFDNSIVPTHVVSAFRL